MTETRSWPIRREWIYVRYLWMFCVHRWIRYPGHQFEDQYYSAPGRRISMEGPVLGL